jgi:hypothetical protein
LARRRLRPGTAALYDKLQGARATETTSRASRPAGHRRQEFQGRPAASH